MATKFTDLAKAPKDLLNDDFTNKYVLKCKKNAGLVGVTIEAEQSANGAVSSKIGTKFSYAKINIDKLQLKADGGKVFESSLEVMPNTKLFFKTNKSAELSVEFIKGNLFCTGVLDVIDTSKSSVSACVSLPSGVQLGGDIGYAVTGPKPGLSSFSAGGSYNAGNLYASIVAMDKLSKCEIGLLYKVNSNLTLGSVTTHSKTKTCDVAGIGLSYKNPSIGTVKAKMGMDHVVHACLINEVAKKVVVTAGASFKPTDLSTFKTGLSISM